MPIRTRPLRHDRERADAPRRFVVIAAPRLCEGCGASIAGSPKDHTICRACWIAEHHHRVEATKVRRTGRKSLTLRDIGLDSPRATQLLRLCRPELHGPSAAAAAQDATEWLTMVREMIRHPAPRAAVGDAPARIKTDPK